MKFKVGDKVVVSPKANPLLGGLSGIVVETQESPIADTAYYKVDLDEERVFPEHHLIAETEYRFLTEPNVAAHQLLATCGIKAADSDTKVLCAKDGTIIGEFNTGGVVSIHDLPTSEWYNPMRLTFKNGSSIEALPNTSDVIRSTSDFCTGFKGGNTPTSLNMEAVKDRTKTMKDWVDSLTDAWAKLGCTTFRVSPREADELIKKEFNVKWIEEEKKMPTKFTFYTEEGYRIDKSNNTRIPTMTTEVLINGKDYQYGGSATCDKTDYEEREGVLNAIANAVCGGNFDREFNKVMKNKAFANKKSRTCTYCGQVFDTVEEKQEHEAWHVERKKARRERYLLRKRAREIAFEEQAQKMAKEMIKEDK